MSVRKNALPAAVSIKTLAKLLSVDERTIRRWQNPEDAADDGPRKPIPHEKRGNATEFPLAAAVAWFVDYRVSIAAGSVSELDLARQRKVTLEAEKAELDLAERRGQLVSADLVEARMTKIAATLRAQLLAAAGRYSPRLIGLGTLPQAQLVMDDIVRALLTELANADDEPNGDGASSAA